MEPLGGYKKSEIGAGVFLLWSQVECGCLAGEKLAASAYVGEPFSGEGTFILRLTPSANQPYHHLHM
jgi:hypothetical protein